LQDLVEDHPLPGVARLFHFNQLPDTGCQCGDFFSEAKTLAQALPVFLRIARLE